MERAIYMSMKKSMLICKKYALLGASKEIREQAKIDIERLSEDKDRLVMTIFDHNFYMISVELESGPVWIGVPIGLFRDSIYAYILPNNREQCLAMIDKEHYFAINVLNYSTKSNFATSKCDQGFAVTMYKIFNSTEDLNTIIKFLETNRDIFVKANKMRNVKEARKMIRDFENREFRRKMSFLGVML